MWQASAIHANKRKRLNLLFLFAPLNKSEFNTGMSGKEKGTWNRSKKSGSEITRVLILIGSIVLVSKLTRVFHWPPNLLASKMLFILIERFRNTYRIDTQRFISTQAKFILATSLFQKIVETFSLLLNWYKKKHKQEGDFSLSKLGKERSRCLFLPIRERLWLTNSEVCNRAPLWCYH